MQESFEDLLDSTEAEIKKNYSDVSDESASLMAVTMLGMSMVYSDEPVEAVQLRTLMHLSVSAANGNPRAKKLADELNASVAATVEKAEKAGANPVDVVMVNHNLSKHLAYNAIAQVRAR